MKVELLHLQLHQDSPKMSSYACPIYSFTMSTNLMAFAQYGLEKKYIQYILEILYSC